MDVLSEILVVVIFDKLFEQLGSLLVDVTGALFEELEDLLVRLAGKDSFRAGDDLSQADSKRVRVLHRLIGEIQLLLPV